HPAVQAQKYDDVGDEAAKKERTAGLLRWGNIVRLDRERLEDADGKIPGGEAVLEDGVAIVVEVFLDFVLGDFGFQIALVVVNEDGLFLLVREIALEAFGDFDDHGNLLVDDFVLPIRFQRNDLNLWHSFQSCENTGRIIAADDHDLGAFFFRLSDQHGDHGAKANAEKRKNDERENKHGDERAAVTESLGQLFTIDDADIARRHLS